MSNRILRSWPMLVVLAGAVLVAIVSQQQDPLPPLHPESTAADGTKALVDSLIEMGADVSTRANEPDDETSVALLLRDNLDDDEHEALHGWVADGGTLVLADAMSRLAPPVSGPAQGMMTESILTDDDCAIGALSAVTQIRPGDPSVLYTERADWVSCFGREGAASAGQATGNWLAAKTEGDGTIVAIGGPEVFINATLDDVDHPMLAASLLAPRPGTQVAFLRATESEDDLTGVIDLMPPSVIMMMIQLALAFGVFAWWRASRHGRVVTEPQPVELPSSEFVAATGRLWQQGRARQRTAEVMAVEVRRTLAERLGLPYDAPSEQIADALAARTSADRDEALATLTVPAPGDDNAMLRFIERLDHLRDTVLRPDAADAVPGASPGGSAGAPSLSSSTTTSPGGGS